MGNTNEVLNKLGDDVTTGAKSAWSWGSTHMQISIPIVTFVLGYFTHWFLH